MKLSDIPERYLPEPVDGVTPPVRVIEHVCHVLERLDRTGKGRVTVSVSVEEEPALQEKERK